MKQSYMHTILTRFRPGYMQSRRPFSVSCISYLHGPWSSGDERDVVIALIEAWARSNFNSGGYGGFFTSSDVAPIVAPEVVVGMHRCCSVFDMYFG